MFNRTAIISRSILTNTLRVKALQLMGKWPDFKLWRESLYGKGWKDIFDIFRGNYLIMFKNLAKDIAITAMTAALLVCGKLAASFILNVRW